MEAPTSPLHVVVAGGGVAGLEALLALRDLAGDRVRITLVAPDAEFVFRPMSVAEPFARGRARRWPLAQMVADLGAELVPGALAAVDGPAHSITLANGSTLSYGALLVAVGAGSEPVFKRAMTWTPASDPEVFGGLLRDLEEGYSERVAFVVPPGVAWSLPAYELALMTAWDAKDMGRPNVAITVFTPEQAPLEVFGVAASSALRADLEQAGVRVETGTVVSEADGHFVLQPGDRRLDAQRVVALPRATAPALRGLPTDGRGFILVDPHGKVPGLENVWAAGDAVSFPVKQGGLAAQQADAAAEAIAAVAGADVDPQPFRPVLRGILLTGRGKEWIRREVDEDPDGSAERHALWWPPTKVAGRYLSPFLFALDEEEDVGGAQPSGQPVELDLEREVPAAADAMRLAEGRREG